MQQTPPRSGNLFPDNPQPMNGPRFASNVPQLPPQPYEPQNRLHQTGSVPVLQQTFGTGQLTPLHNTTPVTQLPPMSTMPVAQAQPAAQRPRRPARQAEAEPAASPAALQGTPLMVHTVQGMPVAVTAEEMQRALDELAAKPGKKNRKTRPQPDEKKKVRKRGKFSLVWNAFAFIGVISVLLLLLEWVGVPLLVLLNDLQIGGTP